MNEELILKDIHNSIDAIEYYITSIEEELIARQARDEEWVKLTPYKATLNNLKLLIAIYGT